MTNSRNIVVFILIALVLIALIAYFSISEKKAYNWNPTFRTEKKQPYDISLFRETIEASYGQDNFNVVGNLETDSVFKNAKNALFIYINRYPGFDSSEVASLAAFAENGNRVFISSNNPGRLMRNLFSDCLPNDSASREYIDHRRAKTVLLSLDKFESDSSLPLRYVVRDEKVRYPWPYFRLRDCEKSEAKTLGSLEAIDRNYVNFIKVERGDGAFYLQSTPLLFTNYYFRKEPAFDFVQKMLTEMPHVRIFYFEPESYQPPPVTNAPPISESPLRFILSNPPLRWAWYLILALTVLFVLNSIRRRQKAIPVFSLPENDTANYLDVVSRMYRKEGRHKHIIGIQEKLLIRHLQNKYRITIRPGDTGSLEEAAERLQMKPAYIRTVFSDIERAKNNSTLTDEEFIKQIDEIKEFYKKCP